MSDSAHVKDFVEKAASGDLEGVKRLLFGLVVDVNAYWCPTLQQRGTDAREPAWGKVALKKKLGDEVRVHQVGLWGSSSLAASDATEIRGFTALLNACRHRHHDVVAILLENDADVSLPCSGGWTPLMEAARVGDADIVTTLLSALQSTHTEALSAIDFQNDVGWTALIEACRNNHSHVAHILLDAKASVLIQDGDQLRAIDHVRADNAPLRILLENAQRGQLIAQSVANSKAPATDLNNELVLECCRLGRNADRIAALLNAKASPDAVSTRHSGGYTALIMACRSHHYGAVELLINARASVIKASKAGWTPLIEAARVGNQKIVQLILRLLRAANNMSHINHQNMLGWTALVEACRNGHEAVVSMLLEEHASKTIADKDGLMPYMHAKEKLIRTAVRPDPEERKGHDADVLSILEQLNAIDRNEDTTHGPQAVVPETGQVDPKLVSDAISELCARQLPDLPHQSSEHKGSAASGTYLDAARAKIPLSLSYAKDADSASQRSNEADVRDTLLRPPPQGQSQPRVFLLQGAPGAGKSFFALRVRQDFEKAAASRSPADNDRRPIPLLLQLGLPCIGAREGLKSTGMAYRLIESYMTVVHKLSPQQIDAVRDYPFVFFIDDVDELATEMDDKSCFIKACCMPCWPQSTFVFCSRTGVLQRSDVIQRPELGARPHPSATPDPEVEEIHILPLSRTQQEDYIAKFFKPSSGAARDLAEKYKAAMFHLCTEPLTLFVALCVLSSEAPLNRRLRADTVIAHAYPAEQVDSAHFPIITRAELYALFVDDWLGHALSHGELKTDSELETAKNRVIQTFAVRAHGALALREECGLDDPTAVLDVEAQPNRVIPLPQDPELRFLHKSLQRYFAALYIATELRSERSAPPATKRLAIAALPLADDVVLLQFVADLVRKDDEKQELQSALRDLVSAAEGQGGAAPVAVKNAAANAALILDRADALFGSRNSSGLVLRYVKDSPPRNACIAVSADGKTPCAGGADRTVRAWETEQAVSIDRPSTQRLLRAQPSTSELIEKAKRACTAGYSPLMFAARFKMTNAVARLIDSCPKTEQVKEVQRASPANGWTALIEASRAGSRPIVEKLLAAKASDGINHQNGLGWTALMEACRNNNTAVIDALLKNKASIDIQDKDGMTALDHVHLTNKVVLSLIPELANGSIGSHASREAPELIAKALEKELVRLIRTEAFDSPVDALNALRRVVKSVGPEVRQAEADGDAPHPWSDGNKAATTSRGKRKTGRKRRKHKIEVRPQSADHDAGLAERQPVVHPMAMRLLCVACSARNLHAISALLEGAMLNELDALRLPSESATSHAARSPLCEAARVGIEEKIILETLSKLSSEAERSTAIAEACRNGCSGTLKILQDVDHLPLDEEGLSARWSSVHTNARVDVSPAEQRATSLWGANCHIPHAYAHKRAKWEAAFQLLLVDTYNELAEHVSIAIDKLKLPKEGIIDDEKRVEHLQALDLVSGLLDNADLGVIGGERGHTLLSIACRFRRVEVVKWLLKEGADVNRKCSTLSVTPLMEAARSGGRRAQTIIEALLEKGAVIDEQDARGMTALAHACRTLPPPDASQDRDREGVIRLLLDHAASTLIKDKDGWRAVDNLIRERSIAQTDSAQSIVTRAEREEDTWSWTEYVV